MISNFDYGEYLAQIHIFQQRIGIAFYLHLGGSLILMFAFIVSTIYSYQVSYSSDK